jgi:hypothetical protein
MKGEQDYGGAFDAMDDPRGQQRGAWVRRREFMTLLGGASAAWPLAARTQPEGVRRIGTLMGYAESESGKPSRGSRASLQIGG